MWCYPGTHHHLVKDDCEAVKAGHSCPLLLPEYIEDLGESDAICPKHTSHPAKHTGDLPPLQPYAGRMPPLHPKDELSHEAFPRKYGITDMPTTDPKNYAIDANRYQKHGAPFHDLRPGELQLPPIKSEEPNPAPPLPPGPRPREPHDQPWFGEGQAEFFHRVVVILKLFGDEEALNRWRARTRGGTPPHPYAPDPAW